MRLPLRWVSILYGKVSADFALTSGVHSAADVVKAMMAGAKVTMMASALLQGGEKVIPAMLADLEAWMKEREYSSVKQMQGSMSQKAVKEPAAFERANYMAVLNTFRDMP
jgi:dihydroorotate dehydrogenase (fumarate)